MMVQVNRSSKLYKMRTDGTDRRLLSDHICNFVNVTDKYIYYVSSSDYKIHRISKDGKDETIMYDDRVTWLVADDEWLFFTKMRGDSGPNYNSGLYKTSAIKPNDEVIELDSFTAGWLISAGEYIYYYRLDANTKDDDKRGIYRITKDGKDLTYITEGPGEWLNMHGDILITEDGNTSGYRAYNVKTKKEVRIFD